MEGKQDGFKAVHLLHLVVVVRRLHVELAQLGYGAVGLSRHVLKHGSEHHESNILLTFFWWAVFSSSENLTLTKASRSKAAEFEGAIVFRSDLFSGQRTTVKD